MKMILSRENGLYRRMRVKSLAALLILIFEPFVLTQVGTTAEPLCIGFLPYILPSKLVDRYIPLAEYRDKGIRELTRSKPLSTHVFIATARLSEADGKLVAELLNGLGNDPVGRRVIEAIGPSVTGFVPATDSDYDGVREIFHTLRAAGVET
jgi:hypothetical protein